MRLIPIFFCCAVLLLNSCSGKTTTLANDSASVSKREKNGEALVLGAEQLDIILPKLVNKRVALVVNHTSMVGKTHLADTLMNRGANIIKIFAPEHGFRGTADAGEQVKDGVDVKTGVPLVSLYGSNKKPTQQQLSDIDVLIFDIQDVGVRFYTYISTMHYVMEASAEQGKKVIILDRPNPNGNFFDGPVLEKNYQSFLGMHQIPVVHGLTIAELAQMINGEGWLSGGLRCDLEVVKMKNWKHTDTYSLPVKPSPNLPNDQAIRLYPSTGLFEGTNISVGRGTQMPFQILGHPDLKNMPFQFTPVSIEGMAKNPPYENKTCYGIDLRQAEVDRKLDLRYLLDMYKAFPEKSKFFKNDSFDTHLGTASLREQIVANKSEAEIRASWKKDLDDYRLKREKYLLYP